MSRLAVMNALKRGLSMATWPEKWAYQYALLSPNKLALPQVIGIGMARSGTTWLFRNLVAHPDVQRRSRKEIHYFNNHFGRPLRWYSSHFEDGDGLRFEITPGYAHLPVSRIRLIASIMPEARIVLLLREPVARAWSETLVRRVGKRGALDHVDDAKTTEVLRRVAEESDYVAILDRWESIFPADRIFVGFFDDIVVRPQTLLSDIFSFAGLAHPDEWKGFPFDEQANRLEPTNRVAPNPMSARQRRLVEDIYRPRWEGMRRRFGDRVSAWIPTA